MVWKSIVVFYFLLTLPSIVVFSQEEIQERLLEEEKDFQDQSDLVEFLQNLLIDVNKAEFDDLRRIPGISPLVAYRILQYRDRVGYINSIEELKNIPELNEGIIEAIKPFLTVRKRSKHSPLRLISKMRMTERLERSEGFKSGIYYNSPQKYLQRLKASFFGRLEVGFLLEKDSGERRLDDLRLLYLKAEELPFKLLLGHYQLELGQGLVMWGPYGFYKGAEVIYPAKKMGRELREYLSTDENAPLFGGALSIGSQRIKFLCFYSNSKLDAGLNPDGTISSFYPSGLHRNQIEEAKKDVVRERIWGSRLSFGWGRRSKIGTTFYFSDYDKSIQNYDYIRKRFAFRGRSNWVGGVDWDIYWENLNLFGETAMSKSRGWGGVVGAIWDFKEVDLVVLFRNYQQDFHSLHSHGFRDHGGKTQNEWGIYYGICFRVTKGTRVSAYYDQFKFPWRTYTDPLPVSGDDFLAQIEQRLGKRVKLTLRAKVRRGDRAEHISNALGHERIKFFQRRRANLRVQLEVRVSPRVRVRGRVERVIVNYRRKGIERFETPSPCAGILLYQDVRLKPLPNLTLYARLTFFDTDSFESRVYQFENDLPGSMTNRALFGRGDHWYLLVRYKPLKFWELSLKYSSTYYEGVDSIGTGPNRIKGNRERWLGVQVDCKL